MRSSADVSVEVAAPAPENATLRDAAAVLVDVAAIDDAQKRVVVNCARQPAGGDERLVTAG